MAFLNKPLLSIAIPTYNRGSLLQISLGRVIEASMGLEEFVEIVVSNNCSDDNTESVINEAQKLYPIRYFKNSENIGFNFNYIKLIDEYVKGSYCWVLGDDDFLHPNAVKEIISVLLNYPDISFISLNFDFKSLETLETETINEIPTERTNGKHTTFNQLISSEGVPGNLMFTFISSVVFKSDLMKVVDKSMIGRESWNSFYNCFPHSYLYAKVMKDKRAYVFDSVLVTAVVHDKEWIPLLWSLYLRFIPELHDHYADNGFSKKDLRNQENLIIRKGIPYLFYNLFSSSRKSKFKFMFLYKYGLKLKFYIILIDILLSKLFKLLKFN